jgi:hypothetical protein
MKALEHRLHVGGEVERVRNDDDVEGLPQRFRIERFARHNEEVSVWHLASGAGDTTCGKVDPADVVRVKQREKIARAAAHFQDPGVGGDEQIVVMGEAAAVGTGAGLQAIRRPVVMRAHFLQVLCG